MTEQSTPYIVTTNTRATALAELLQPSVSDADIDRIAAAVVARLAQDAAFDDIPEMVRPMRQAEAAAFLGIDPATLSLMTSAGDVPCFRVSERRPVYLKADLVEWLRSRPYVTAEAA